jgi:hypothetical protein
VAGKYRYRVLEGPIKESVEHDTRVLCEWKEEEEKKRERLRDSYDLFS